MEEVIIIAQHASCCCAPFARKQRLHNWPQPAGCVADCPVWHRLLHDCTTMVSPRRLQSVPRDLARVGNQVAQSSTDDDDPCSLVLGRRFPALWLGPLDRRFPPAGAVTGVHLHTERRYAIGTRHSTPWDDTPSKSVPSKEPHPVPTRTIGNSRDSRRRRRSGPCAPVPRAPDRPELSCCPHHHQTCTSANTAATTSRRMMMMTRCCCCCVECPA